MALRKAHREAIVFGSSEAKGKQAPGCSRPRRECMPELLADPRSLRDAYLAEVDAFRETVRRGCLGQKIDYVKLVNDQPLDVVLSSYLAARAARSKRFK